MAKSNRRRAPFYLRRKPLPQHDILLLCPPSLPLGHRFETLKDAHKYSVASECKLGLETLQQDGLLADRLNECRKSPRWCGQSFCPICARRFRIWFVGELLRIIDDISPTPVHVVTVLHDPVPSDQIELLNVKAFNAVLRKRLSRSGLDDAVVIGGTEVIYRAKSKSWVLHHNLVIIGGTSKAIEQFATRCSNGEIARPVLVQQLTFAAKQLSYILKFTTYHRPFGRLGSTKSKPVPLNPREHSALVSWMAQWRFQDFMFLFNARREGDKIVSGTWSRLTF